MTVVKKGDGNIGFGGKPLPPKGEQKYVFNGSAELRGDAKEMLVIQAEYAIDPDGTAPVECLCFLGNEKGLEALMSIIIDSGVYKKLMAKDKSLPDPEKDGWDDEQILLNPKFIEQLGIELVGCPAYITIDHELNQWKDNKGNDRERMKSRVLSIRPFDGKSSKVKTEDKKAETTDEWDK